MRPHLAALHVSANRFSYDATFVSSLVESGTAAGGGMPKRWREIATGTEVG
jgi:hypothetical protein